MPSKPKKKPSQKNKEDAEIVRIVEESPHHQPNEGTGKPSHECSETNNKTNDSINPFWQRWKKDSASDQAMVVLTSALAAFTFILVTFNLWQINTYKSAVQDDLRAYIIANAEFGEAHWPRPRAEIKITNVGKTQASKVKLVGKCFIATETSIEGRLRELSGVTQDSGYTLGPGVAYEETIFAPEVFPNGEKDSLVIDPLRFRLYFGGRIVYEDKYGQHRYTNFLLFWNVHNKRPARDPRHNDAN